MTKFQVNLSTHSLAQAIQNASRQSDVSITDTKLSVAS